MASGNKSRWGSLLSQAVAGVEARLDTILAEEDEALKNTKPGQQTTASAATSTTTTSSASAPTSSKSSPGPSRTSSSNRVNDRLQERLARAMAAKAAARQQNNASVEPSVSSQPSPRQSFDTVRRASGESADRPGVNPSEPTSQRVSQDVPRISLEAPSVTASEKDEKDAPQEKDDTGNVQQEQQTNGHRDSAEIPIAEAKVDLVTEPSTRTSVESEIPTIAATTDVVEKQVEEEPEEQVEDPLEAAKLQHQEEVHGYVERIDALEAKLQYLAREVGQAARKEAAAAPAGSAEKKLAEKDQQIAQLMEEGKNLASTEQKHRTIIKKLRVKVADEEKQVMNLKTTHDKTAREVEELRTRARRADELEKANEELRRRLEQSQKEANTLRPDVKAKDATITDLKAKLTRATEQAEAMTAKVNDQAREQDRKRIAELEESVAALQVEKNLVADRAKNQVNELKEKTERANERSRVLELEMKAEVQIMESKLEAMRIQAEEASSGAGGDSQAKLLRQVETLQTQYAIASENWQGIESTLLARIGNLEKERDDALHRESDMRKKAREASLRAKRTEEELEETRTKIPSYQEDAKTYQTQLDSLRTRAEQAEASLLQAKAELEKQKQAYQSEREEKQQQQQQQQQQEDRRGGWLEEVSRSNSRPESPLHITTPQRSFSSDLLGLDVLPNKLRKPSAPSSNGAGDRLSRRPSFQPPVRPTMTTHSSSNYQHSPSPGVFSPTMESLPTPSTHPLDREDAESQSRFDGVETGSTPHQVLQDMVSVSTVAAGPSVQLVERMSAAIRRLESEKVAAKEELARISNQRDEARAELLALMREADKGREAAARVEALERTVAETNDKYEATLEELGEKIEMVEELRADVQDVKAMYRELVERTVGK